MSAQVVEPAYPGLQENSLCEQLENAEIQHCEDFLAFSEAVCDLTLALVVKFTFGFLCSGED